ncbi:hypothetical protein D3C73_872690 [compost metagenome]
MTFQGLKGFAVAKEVGHANQHVAQQKLGFRWRVFQIREVGLEVRLGGDLQAPLDPPQDRGALVMLEIVACAIAQQVQDVLQGLFSGSAFKLGRIGCHIHVVRWRQFDGLRIQPQLQQLVGNFCNGEHHVHQTSGNGGQRHAVELSITGFLYQRDAALFLDPRQPHRAIAAGARQDNAKGVFLVHVSQVPEEQVNRDMISYRTAGRNHSQIAIIHRQLAGGRNHVHLVWLDWAGVAHLLHRHAGSCLDNVVSHTFVIR